MYHLTVTAKQWPATTNISVALWEIQENGTREQVKYSGVSVPVVQGGLFEDEPEVFLEMVIEWLTDIHGTWRHTHQ